MIGPRIRKSVAEFLSFFKRLIQRPRQKTRVPSDLFKKTLTRRYAEQSATVVQIGVCDGRINDPLYDIVKNIIKTDTIVLIEPQTELIDKIAENYRFHSDARIVNCAIGPQGQITLYKLAEKYHSLLRRDYLSDAPGYRVPAGFVSANREHVINHVQGKLEGETIPEDAIQEFTVECKNLLSIFKEINITTFDILQIDCEGMDDIVLYNCNLDQLKPSIVNFEHMHLSPHRKERVFEFLESMGYNVFEYSHTDTLATTLQLKDANLF